ncbi:hypothetical protein WAB17_12475 [Parerythrobacter aurantius]|uniref:hypothetical protein n=1 Tax=Parerythrobacter aurantius TaxID=3127706 RepID=UPI003253C624
MAKTPTGGAVGKTPAGKTPAKPSAAKSAVKAPPIKPVPAKEPEVTNREEAKSRFNAALEEAKAGAAALKAEAGLVVGGYRDQAKGKSTDLVSEARVYGDEAKARAGELAVEGKAKASDALAALGQLVADNAAKIDENFGPQYGDYARTAARSLQENAAKLEAKSLEELGEDAKTFVREKPATALGIAAVAGYLLSRIFRR